MVKYIEMTIREALKVCDEHTRVLVAVQDFASKNNSDAVFVKKKKDEYEQIFEDVETVFCMCDDFVNQLRCFTCKQEDIHNIKPEGVLKIVLLLRN